MTKSYMDSVVASLRSEAEAAWRRYVAHEKRHGCHGWIFTPSGVRLDRDCYVGMKLARAWLILNEAAQLPSPDPRAYSNENAPDVASEAISP
jgi:hypothetical protein